MEVRIPSLAPGLPVKSDESGVNLNEDFEIYSSSDEDGEGGKKEWEPAPERIVELYNQIASGKIPELTWKCPGRREPSVEGDDEEDMDESQHLEEEAEKPTAFDFDSMFSEPSQPIGQQRKAIGTLKVQQKRVARLDKILNDMKKDTSSFQLQSPRLPYQTMSRIDNLPGTALFDDDEDNEIPAETESGIPLPAEFTFKSPPPNTETSGEADDRKVNIEPETSVPMTDNTLPSPSEPLPPPTQPPPE